MWGIYTITPVIAVTVASRVVLYKVGGILCQKHQNLKPWLAFGVLALALLKFV